MFKLAALLGLPPEATAFKARSSPLIRNDTYAGSRERTSANTLPGEEKRGLPP